MEWKWDILHQSYETFIQFYSQFATQPDTLGLTWTKEEFKELASVYIIVATGLDIEQHLSGYPASPAGAVASLLPKVTPEDIIRHDVCPPTISQSKQLVAIHGEPCSIRASILVASERGILIMQRDEQDSYGGEWEFPGGQINAGERVSEGSARELEEETSLKRQTQSYSYDMWDGRKDSRKWYGFNSFAKFNRDEPGWEKCIQLSVEHQGFAWIKQKDWSKFAPGREKNIEEGLSVFADGLLHDFSGRLQGGQYATEG
ncbi:hypothetical protein BDW68DRAFT_166968 [Aspergillus falconensis]